MNKAQSIKVGDIYQYDGYDVEVIGVDSDPTASVAVIPVENRDRAIFAQPHELS